MVSVGSVLELLFIYVICVFGVDSAVVDVVYFIGIVFVLYDTATNEI